MECLMCDKLIKEAYGWINNIPVCSEPCMKEYENLTYDEKLRYLECTYYIRTGVTM